MTLPGTQMCAAFVPHNANNALNKGGKRLAGKSQFTMRKIKPILAGLGAPTTTVVGNSRTLRPLDYRLWIIMAKNAGDHWRAGR